MDDEKYSLLPLVVFNRWSRQGTAVNELRSAVHLEVCQPALRTPRVAIPFGW
jgi:hypothetical protein